MVAPLSRNPSIAWCGVVACVPLPELATAACRRLVRALTIPRISLSAFRPWNAIVPGPPSPSTVDFARSSAKVPSSSSSSSIVAATPAAVSQTLLRRHLRVCLLRCHFRPCSFRSKHIAVFMSFSLSPVLVSVATARRAFEMDVLNRLPSDVSVPKTCFVTAKTTD